MRDPEATLDIGVDHVTRQLRHPLPSDHFLNSSLAKGWVEEGSLVRFDVLSPQRVSADRLPFVTQPTEWCDAQLHDAAKFTLRLQAEAVANGFDMKDASAWNVLFDGSQPVFCDLMSFMPLQERKWWAAGQFARHFIAPLAVARQRGLSARSAFLMSRDGMPPEQANRLLGLSRFMTRFWPALAEAPSPSKGVVQQHGKSADGAVPTSMESIRKYRNGLHNTLGWIVDGARPRAVAPASVWSAYEANRDHYTLPSLDAKRRAIHEWLQRIAPEWALDLGCNAGEFSRLAVESGANVVSIDADHASVQALYQRADRSRRIHPLVASLDDLSGGRGWLGQEHPALMTRLDNRFDVVLMLALIHHLAVANAVPLRSVAELARRCTRKWLIIEWIDPSDPQLSQLCAQRQRHPDDFSISAQVQAFIGAGFLPEAEIDLVEGKRKLALLRRAA